MSHGIITKRSSRALAGLAAAVALLAGALSAAPSTAQAADADDSSLTIKWLNDDSRAASLQPDRQETELSKKEGLPQSPHLEEFKDLKVTVDRTQGLRDEVVTIKVSGMPGGTQAARVGMAGFEPGNGFPSFAQNYLQATQCWGDPLADNFRETCQWGGMAATDSTSQRRLLETVLQSGSDRPVPLSSGGMVPFRSVQNKLYQGGLPNLETEPGYAKLASILNPDLTNDVIGWPVQADGTTVMSFSVQTALQAPWLGCGAPDPAHGGAPRSCSIVLFPRGTLWEGENTGDKNITTPATYGEPGMQKGSPLSKVHDIWDKRIVIPLDFAPITTGCAVTQQPLTMQGSELGAAEAQSWQGGLCADEKLPFSYTTASDPRVRDELVRGNIDLALTARGVDPAELSPDARESFAQAKMVYAPLAGTALGIGFKIVDRGGWRTQVKLTPRLIAKLMTQSYKTGVQSDDGSHIEHLNPVNPGTLVQDPEFKRLNPDIIDPVPGGMGDMVLVGPNESDAVRLLWQYLQADEKARAFLAGKPDNELPGDEKNSGMTINPYYLPTGNPAAVAPKIETYMKSSNFQVREAKRIVEKDGKPVMAPVGLQDATGAPLDLSRQPISTFLQADRTPAPWELFYDGQTFFEADLYNPFAETFEKAASRINSGDRRRPFFDFNNTGRWKTAGRQVAPMMFTFGVTDVTSAVRDAVPMAALQVPNREDEFVQPTTETIQTAMAGMADDPITGTKWMDFAKLPEGGYPLTMLTYAAANINALDDASDREAYAKFLDYATGAKGQTPGRALGSLPEGYVPLSEPLLKQAATAIQAIRKGKPTTTSTQSSKVGNSQSDGGSQVGRGAEPQQGPDVAGTDTSGLDNSGTIFAPDGQPVTADAGPGAPNNAPQADGVEPAPQPTTETQVDAAVENVAAPLTVAEQSSGTGPLSGALGLALVGVLACPLFLRRRGSNA